MVPKQRSADCMYTLLFIESFIRYYFNFMCEFVT